MQQRSLDLFFSPRGAGASKAAKAARRDEQGGASPSRQEGEKTLKRLKKTSAADDEPEPEPEPRRQSVIGISLAGDGSAAQTPPKKKGLSLKPPGKGDNPGGSTAAKGGVSLAGVGQKSIAAAGDQKAFNSKDGAKWSASAPVPYSVVTETFDKVASDRARLTKIKFLTELYRTVIATTPEDLLPIVYLSTNALAPAHEGIELGIGDATIIKALSECTGRTEKKIKDDLKREGDLGVVALSSRSTQSTLVQPKPLLVRQVFQDFKAIAMTSGQSSVERKKKIIKRLLTSSKKTEATYVVRALQGKLRIGSSELTVLPALSKAIMWEKGEVDASSKEAIAESEERGHIILKQAYFEYPNLEVIVPALLEHGVLGIAEHCKFTVGVPVKPMLAKATTGVQEVLDKFTDVEFTCEYKYDGERAQIHYEEGKGIKIFSRNSENNAPKYPELVSEIIPASLKPTTKSLVLDGEVVAYDKVKKEILRFQLLQKRKRKDVSDEDMKNQAAVCYFAFDCLHYNGQSLLRSSLVERRKALREACEEREGNFFFATDKTSSDVEELQAFLDESIVAKTEGLIIKTIDSTYEPSQRSLNWLKLKKDYMLDEDGNGMGDSLDLVVLGAWHGKGKRKGLYGNYLLACYNPDSEEFETISKIGTGFSEEALETVKEELDAHIIEAPRPYYKYNDGDKHVPDVWFDAQVVWEVRCADFTVSPVYQAAVGLADDTKGISVRFPRYLRTRDDRKATTALSSADVYEYYRNQAMLKNKGDKSEWSD